jgi:hypothetical protein
VKLIKPTYRAQFRQPLGVLNPLGAKLSVPIHVEIFEAAIGQWKLRRPGTRAIFEPVLASGTAEGAKAAARECFESQLTDWVMFYQEEELKASEYVTRDNGKVYLLEPEDFTHTTAQVAMADKTAALSACGYRLKHAVFASTLENAPPPSCSACAAFLKERRASA